VGLGLGLRLLLSFLRVSSLRTKRIIHHDFSIKKKLKNNHNTETNTNTFLLGKKKQQQKTKIKTFAVKFKQRGHYSMLSVDWHEITTKPKDICTPS